jgi:hypothetical protein
MMAILAAVPRAFSCLHNDEIHQAMGRAVWEGVNVFWLIVAKDLSDIRRGSRLISRSKGV